MTRTKSLAAAGIRVVSIIQSDIAQGVDLYTYSPTVTTCGPNCFGMNALDIGSRITGQFLINVNPGSSFGDADMSRIVF